MTMIKKNSSLPTLSELMAWEEFLDTSGMSEERLEELIEMGWLTVSQTQGNARLFLGTDIYKVRKVERICCDFELPTLGGAIIVDLLERIAILEKK